MTSYDMSVKNDFPKTQLYKNDFVQLTKFLGFAAPQQDHYCKSHNVNVNTFLQKPGLNLFEEKKILQTNEKEKKISCPAGLQEKNFADQKSPTQPHVRTALLSSPSTFHLFFTSHCSRLSERLEQATPQPSLFQVSLRNTTGEERNSPVTFFTHQRFAVLLRKLTHYFTKYAEFVIVSVCLLFTLFSSIPPLSVLHSGV